MAKTPHHPILTYLRKMLGASTAGGVSDADLLSRFVAERDRAAFELLLWRHAAMVLHVCRQVLGDADDAEDAFQATFLVFVRKAGTIGRREALGAWLYRVAYHLALKARAKRKERTATAAELDHLEAPAESDDAERADLGHRGENLVAKVLDVSVYFAVAVVSDVVIQRCLAICVASGWDYVIQRCLAICVASGWDYGMDVWARER